jgi:hypothetical protein
MPGRHIHLVATAVASALAVAISASASLACCGGCVPAYMAPPPVTFGLPCASCASSGDAPPVVYSSPCASYGAVEPSYRVDFGPIYRRPIAVLVEPVGDYVYPRRYPYVSHSGRSLAYRSWAYRHSRPDVATGEDEDGGAYRRPIMPVDQVYEDDGYRAPRHRGSGVYRRGDMASIEHRTHHTVGPRLVGGPSMLHRDVHKSRGPVTGKPHQPERLELIR